MNTVRAQEIIHPVIEITNRSFAIVTDGSTFEKCQKELISYRDRVESEGLPTLILHHDWKNPEQLKKELQKLYKIFKIEGVVFIGEIPIPMVLKAQHLTNVSTAIPSDRFYDDFELTFDFLEQSKTDPQLYFYNLGANSPNRIKSTIYSARIKPIISSEKNGDKYEQIRAYLDKVVKVRQEKNLIDQIMSYVAFESLSSWSSQSLFLEEQFPLVSKTSTQFQNFKDDKHRALQDEVVNQFRREDLDIAIIHQYPLSDVAAIQPNVALTIFADNPTGNFSESAYNAGQFILGTGNALVALAHTVQPSSHQHATYLMGTLGAGLNIGQWLKLNNTLESHLFGDPTFTFSIHTPDTLSKFIHEKDNKKLIDVLSKAKSPEAQSFLLNQLFMNNYGGLAKLITQHYDNSQYATVRYTCIHIADRLEGEVRAALFAKGIKDADESIRLEVINAIARIGDPAFIPALIDAYMENQHAEEVLYAIKMALYAFNKDLIKNIAEHRFMVADNFSDNTKEKERFYENQFTGLYIEIDKNIFDTNVVNQKKGITDLRTIRYHPSVTRYLEFVRNSKINVDLRIAMLESLSCFRDSYRKAEIAAACKELMVDTRHSKRLRDEARRTLNNIN
ncbi:HEAT repeat domain-containing protein [Sphingobacterium faecale]|uniref:HEAT repeat domain-containing protein n=1 Tax=Sphingobacterium faecale TaxID=2803775 RepID=A0ABS1R4G1_9SPHI|nr:HEAT repeat domain-containing protein [Sphingobacterium faecale]MBL1409596.1 HEAT repeat domain-containing protein [Sphingobacterium faecale]